MLLTAFVLSSPIRYSSPSKSARQTTSSYHQLRRTNPVLVTHSSFLPSLPTINSSTSPLHYSSHSSQRVATKCAWQSDANETPTKIISDSCTTLIYTIIPCILTGHIVLPAIGQEVSTAVEEQLPQQGIWNQIMDALAEDTPLFNLLVKLVFISLIYITIGAIILSIDSFIVNRNDKRNRKLVKERVENAGKKDPKGNPSSGLNRQQRRIEKKMKEQEQREQKRKAKKDTVAKTSGDDKLPKS